MPSFVVSPKSCRMAASALSTAAAASHSAHSHMAPTPLRPILSTLVGHQQQQQQHSYNYTTSGALNSPLKSASRSPLEEFMSWRPHSAVVFSSHTLPYASVSSPTDELAGVASDAFVSDMDQLAAEELHAIFTSIPRINNPFPNRTRGRRASAVAFDFLDTMSVDEPVSGPGSMQTLSSSHASSHHGWPAHMDMPVVASPAPIMPLAVRAKSSKPPSVSGGSRPTSIESISAVDQAMLKLQIDSHESAAMASPVKDAFLLSGRDNQAAFQQAVAKLAAAASASAPSLPRSPAPIRTSLMALGMASPDVLASPMPRSPVCM
ncbi:hypothetical protein BC831DRAFT_474951 [Entophlyctis helioformis]|nr:hypothetical protein BC831DRAFT_474951 [Entophlyctis helioformis]